MHACVLSCVQLFVILWTVACQATLSLEFSKQEYWTGLQFPPPSDLPDLGIELMSPLSPALVGGFFTTAQPRKTLLVHDLPQLHMHEGIFSPI